MNKVFLILTCYLLSACSPTSKVVEGKIELKEEKTGKELTYLALGDSYTVGEGVDPSLSFPMQLSKALNEKEISINKPKILAKTGWRTDELLQASSQIPINKKFDLVSLLIGVNNQYQGGYIRVFEEEFKQLLVKSIDHSKKQSQGVFVFSIPDYSVSPFMEKSGKDPSSVSKEIRSYNEIIRSVCQEYDVNFYYITKLIQIEGKDPDMFAKDGLHPSAKMYNLWIMKKLDKIISNHF